MTSSSQKPDPNEGPIVWPSIGFYFGALRRQGPLALLVCIPVALLIIFGLTRIKTEYTSEITVLYDTTTAETLDGGHATVLSAIATRIGSSFESSVSNPDYLQGLMDKLPRDDEEPAGGPSLGRRIKSWIPSDFFSSKYKTPEQEEREQRQEALGKTLTPVFSERANALTLNAKGKSPQAAQTKARLAMEQFMIGELEYRLKGTLEKIRELSATESKYLKEKEEYPEVGSTYQEREVKDEVSPERQRELKAKEQKIVKDLLTMRTDLERARTNYDINLSTLENQLNNLQSRKGAEHPEVIQKRSELEKVKSAPTWMPIDQAMGLLKTKLSEVQREMVSLGLPVDRSAQIAFFPTDTQLTLSNLSIQIRKLEVLADSLKKDILDPWRSRHFNIARDATFSVIPSNKKQLFVALGVGFVLIILIFFLIVISRELTQPYVVASEQLRNRHAIPDERMVEVNRRWLKSVPPFDLEKIRRLKPELSQLPQKGSPELRLLDAYRHLAQLVESMPGHQVISFFDTGFKNNTSNVAYNLAQVLAADSGRRVLFMSFRSDLKNQGSGSGDLMDFLSGQLEWKDVRIKGDGSSQLDLAYAQDPSKTLSNFQEATLIRLFKILREKYSLIVIDALLPIYNVENGILHKLSDTVLLQVRLNETRDQDVARLLQFLDREKIAATLVST